jgi:hypothetical protein
VAPAAHAVASVWPRTDCADADGALFDLGLALLARRATRLGVLDAVADRRTRKLVKAQVAHRSEAWRCAPGNRQKTTPVLTVDVSFPSGAVYTGYCDN